jgi:hypothetical protein
MKPEIVRRLIKDAVQKYSEAHGDPLNKKQKRKWVVQLYCYTLSGFTTLEDIIEELK